MILFLTSSPFLDEENAVNPANGFEKELLSVLPPEPDVLYICSSPCAYELNDEYARRVRESIESSGISPSRFILLDGRNADGASALVRTAQLIILAGGHVPTQNAFFEAIGLRELLSGSSAVIVGVSAGTMNCADVVYAQPELEGETGGEYERFIKGLGLTDINILPHYAEVKDMTVDGLRAIEDIALPDSARRTFYAIPDGSYVFCRDGVSEMRGEAFLISNGRIEPFCADGQRRKI